MAKSLILIFFGGGHFLPCPSDVKNSLNKPRSNNQFVWGPSLEQAFQKSRKSFTMAPVLVTFDPMRKSIISAMLHLMNWAQYCNKTKKMDNSSQLLLPHGHCQHWKSITLSLKKEVCTITWACKHLHDFISGLHFMIETDCELLWTFLWLRRALCS